MPLMTPMAAEKTPIDRQSAAVDLLRLERIETSLVHDIEVLRDRNMTFPSDLTQRKLDKALEEHETVTALMDELRGVLDVGATLPA
jgi:hypothetical protein